MLYLHQTALDMLQLQDIMPEGMEQNTLKLQVYQKLIQYK
jgi:hypothetical protein